MKILLPVVLLLAAAGAVMWVLAPADDAPTAVSGRSARATAPQVEIEPGAAPDKGDAKGKAKAKARSKLADIPTVYPPKPGAAEAKAMAAAAIKRDTRRRFVAQTPFSGTYKWGRARVDPTPVFFDLDEVRGSIRQFYGNLPKTGPVPIVTAEELLSADVLRQLNLPPEGQVTELGEWPISDRRGFESVLKGDYHIGITVVDERGESVREYIMAKPKPQTP